MSALTRDFSKHSMDAIDARYEAQKIAFAPVVFQATHIMPTRIWFGWPKKPALTWSKNRMDWV